MGAHALLCLIIICLSAGLFRTLGLAWRWAWVTAISLVGFSAAMATLPFLAN